jgi:hypothetical protein
MATGNCKVCKIEVVYKPERISGGVFLQRMDTSKSNATDDKSENGKVVYVTCKNGDTCSYVIQDGKLT